MYKNQLQQICQQRQWAIPEYTSSRDGPDHNPRFRASVTVNGTTFDSPDVSRSSKEAQNKASKVAVDFFAANLPPKPPALDQANQMSYKSQLVNYVQRKKCNPPKYDSVREGSAHALCFKATVTVDGHTFYSSQFFNTLKEAEHDAAKNALVSLSLEENPQDEPNFYKNLLQQLLQKEGISLPKYNTVSDGASHMPIFSSIVEVEGENFEGDVARTKKQAEMNAAKVAYLQLKDRLNSFSGRVKRLLPDIVLNCSMLEDLETAASHLQPMVIKNMDQPKPLSVPVSYVKMETQNRNSVDKNHEDAVTVKDDNIMVNAAAILKDDQGAHSFKETMVNAAAILKVDQGTHSSKEAMVNSDSQIDKIIKDQQGTHSSGETMAYSNSQIDDLATTLQKLKTEATTNKYGTISQGGTSSLAAPSEGSNSPIAGMASEFPMNGTTCSLLCNRVMVYPRKPGTVLPESATLLPFSDDMWVAVSLDFSNHSGGTVV